jgi:Gram-negative bacterial TonB protein C-terminal
MKKDVQFFELLQKWLQGDFGNKDEKELNSMLKNDDFQREAMEGYQVLPEANHEARLLAMKKVLRERTQPVATPVLSLQRMLSVAAVFAFLVAAFWFIPRVLDRKQGEVAQNLPVLEKKEIPEVISMDDKEAPKLDKVVEKNPTLGGGIAKDELAKPQASTIQNSKTEVITINSSGVTSAVAASDEVALVKTTSRATTIMNENVVEKSEERKREPADDKIVSPAVASAPSTAAPSKPNDDIAVAKRNSKASTSTKKKESPKEDVTYNKTDTKPNMEALKDKNEEMPASSEPAGGWEAFNEYCRTNARLTDTARDNNVAGIVRLQFNVSNNGDPINFLTIKSLGYGCDEEAIRLVKDFEWIRGKNGLVNVEIKFAR